MAWNPQHQYMYQQLTKEQEWNPYAAANGMWNMMSMFPGLLPGANISHAGLIYPMTGNKQEHTHSHAIRLLKSEIASSPPEEQPYEPLILSKPSRPRSSSSSVQLSESSQPSKDLLPLVIHLPHQEASLPLSPPDEQPYKPLELSEPSRPPTPISPPDLSEPSIPLTSLSSPQFGLNKLPKHPLVIHYPWLEASISRSDEYLFEPLKLSEQSQTPPSSLPPDLADPSLAFTPLPPPQFELNKLPENTLSQIKDLPQSEISPPLSPHSEEHPYEPLCQLSEPSLPLNLLSPPHSPPLDLNDKDPTPSGHLYTVPHTNPFLQLSLGTTPLPLSHKLPIPQTSPETQEDKLASLAKVASALLGSQQTIQGSCKNEVVTPLAAAAAALLGSRLTDVATTDTNGRKLPRWKIKRSICKVCNKRFESHHKLQLHMHIHTGERPYQCEICGLRFGRRFCYKRHLKVHTTIKPYDCPRCGRSFREKYDMETHLMTEVCLRSAIYKGPITIDQPFICKECKASFTSMNALTVHSEVHKKQSLTACPICKVGFSQPEVLMQHLHEQHPGNRDNQEEKKDPLELPFNFQEQIKAFKESQDIVYLEQ